MRTDIPLQAVALVVFAVGSRLAALGDEGQGDVGETPSPGHALPGLSDELDEVFEAGEDEFEHEFTPEEGLGPVFIERSCLACHALGGIGGGDSLSDPNHFVQRFATLTLDGAYNPLAALGGDVLQTRSIAGMVDGCNVEPEVVPPDATISSFRNPLAMFGAGLMDAIPDAAILLGAGDKGDGVKGRPNLDGAGRPGRFGWKSQGTTLLAFNAVAFNGTMGITTPQSAAENKPQGLDIPDGCTNEQLGASTPNDPGGRRLISITAWAALLAPVAPKSLNDEGERGRQVFGSIGCWKCHTPTMMTGDYVLALPDGSFQPVDALSRKPAHLYSDLLIHDMGAGLDDKVTMRQAKGKEFRTAPLWGIHLRNRFLHDGRAFSVDEAIRAHGGEAQVIRDRYSSLPERDREALLRFLRRL